MELAVWVDAAPHSLAEGKSVGDGFFGRGGHLEGFEVFATITNPSSSSMLDKLLDGEM